MTAITLIVAGIILVSVWIIGFYLDKLSTDMKAVKILLAALAAGPPKGGGSHERAE
jgi:hypothetical protein